MRSSPQSSARSSMGGPPSSSRRTPISIARTQMRALSTLSVFIQLCVCTRLLAGRVCTSTEPLPSASLAWTRPNRTLYSITCSMYTSAMLTSSYASAGLHAPVPFGTIVSLSTMPAGITRARNQGTGPGLLPWLRSRTLTLRHQQGGRLWAWKTTRIAGLWSRCSSFCIDFNVIDILVIHKTFRAAVSTARAVGLFAWLHEFARYCSTRLQINPHLGAYGVICLAPPSAAQA